MKKLTKWILILFVLCILIVLIVQRKNKNLDDYPKSSYAESGIFLLNGNIKCKKTYETEAYTRIVTDSIVNEKFLQFIADTLGVNTNITYFHLPGLTETGEEYGMLTGNFNFVDYNFSRDKVINARVKKQIKEAQNKRNLEDIETNKFGAFIASKNIITKMLKAPGTAKFAESYDKDVVMIYDSETNNYIVYLWVDAQNSFGAMLRNYYKVTLKLSGDQTQWKLVDIISE